MKHLAAYLLLVLGGNDSPTAKDIKNVLDSVGIEADDDRIKKLLGEVKGKDLNDVCHPFFSFHLILFVSYPHGSWKMVRKERRLIGEY